MKNKQKTSIWVFLYMKYDKFWSILLEHFVELKILISIEWEGRAKEAGLVGYLVSLGGVELIWH